MKTFFQHRFAQVHLVQSIIRSIVTHYFLYNFDKLVPTSVERSCPMGSRTVDRSTTCWFATCVLKKQQNLRKHAGLGMSYPVVGLGLGEPEARLKRGALWWRHRIQPTVIITFWFA